MVDSTVSKEWKQRNGTPKVKAKHPHDVVFCPVSVNKQERGFQPKIQVTHDVRRKVSGSTFEVLLVFFILVSRLVFRLQKPRAHTPQRTSQRSDRLDRRPCVLLTVRRYLSNDRATH